MAAVAPTEWATPGAGAGVEEYAARFRHDPLGFVIFAFPWGSGQLRDKYPYEWQIETLEYIGEQLRIQSITVSEAIQIARRSGHGIGKSALVAWLVIWAMSTLVDTRGVVTANTEAQLRGKTWPELAKWHALSITNSWFKFTATSYFSTDPEHEKNWRVDCVPWSINNTEAFAGLHNLGRRILLIMDEASAIPDDIHEVSEGALTDEDTEIIWCQFGNPTRNQGRFHESFNRLRHRWNTASIDSRTVPGTNKRQIQKWLEDYPEGEDSDFFRVRVRGMAPRASYNQYISDDLVRDARNREMRYHRPQVATVGVDVARFGGDESVIRTRMGRDGRSFEPIRFRGAKTTTLVAAIAEHINYLRSLGLRVVTYVDGGAMGGPVVDMLQDLGYEVIEVLFGGVADNPRRYFNKRAEMYGRLRDWLKTGYLDKDDEQFEKEATAILYTMPKDVIQLERKEVLREREHFSPDDVDAFATTFAFPIPAPPPPGSEHLLPPGTRAGSIRRAYDPIN